MQRPGGPDREARRSGGPPSGEQVDLLRDELFPAEQARIVALIVERVDIGADGLDVRLRIDGLGGLAREMQACALEKAA